MIRVWAWAAAIGFGFAQGASAFCGFYVAQEGALYNEASKIVLARHGTTTDITMASDVSGTPREFALVIPVPTVVRREQVRVIKAAEVDHLEAYTVPRLVEYFDEDPCPPPVDLRERQSMAVPAPMAMPGPRMAAEMGVRIEAQYSVGEYDIEVLSARDSSGLITYLNTNNYQIPAGAGPVIGSYLKQKMNFFVAKVNLKRQAASGSTFLSPIQVEYESPKFMLPIRLGTVNAKGPQDMIVLALTERGRVETTNYQTRKVPTGVDVPLALKDDFQGFYRAVFDRQVGDAAGSATFLEYAWDLGRCDPCSAPPLSAQELTDLGAGWASDRQPPFVTRLHVRYDRAHFPEDLTLQETGDREDFQARYVMHHPFTGKAECDAGKRYTAGLPARARAEAGNVVGLTNWSFADVRARMEAAGQAVP